jgi:hypothetical protein
MNLIFDGRYISFTHFREAIAYNVKKERKKNLKKKSPFPDLS